jgi:hypothetical protein
MTLATEGQRVYEYDHLLSGERELFAHEGGLFVVYDHGRDAHVSIEVVGMTKGEIARAIAVADTVMSRAPVNRGERRAVQ